MTSLWIALYSAVLAFLSPTLSLALIFTIAAIYFLPGFGTRRSELRGNAG